MPKIGKNKTVTYKQKRFIQEYIKTNGNGKQSALRVYDTTKENIARSIASENLSKPNVKEELERALKKDDLHLSRFTSKMSDIMSTEPQKGYSGADIVNVIQTGLKLHGVLTDRKQVMSYNINADLNKLSIHELTQLRNKKKQDTDTILNDT